MAEIISPNPLDRLLTAFRRLVRAEVPELTYSAAYEYTVVNTDGGKNRSAKTVDAVPSDTSVPLPGLTKVPITLPFGVSPEKGQTCIIIFLNADPTRPRCVGFDISPRTELGGDTALDAARKGDLVNIVLPPFQFVGNAVFAQGPAVLTGTMIVAAGGQTLAAITSGSSKVGIA